MQKPTTAMARSSNSKPQYQDLGDVEDDGGINSDFMFLREHSRRMDWKEYLLQKDVLIKAAVGAVLLTCFVLSIVAISRPRTKVYERQCLEPLGGGAVGGKGSFSPLHDPHCDQITRNYLSKGGQYWDDVFRAADSGAAYFHNYTRTGQLKSSDVVVFDIDETCLSNIDEFLTRTKPGGRHHSSTLPALIPMLHLYQGLYGQGLQVTFLTGRSESERENTTNNLVTAGFGQMCARDNGKPVRSEEPCWLQLDLRPNGDLRPASVYKPEKRSGLVQAGYTLAGNFGDQFSDLVGEPAAVASFKLPNPMYFLL